MNEIWGDNVPKGQSDSNQNECWKRAKQNVENAIGIWWDHNTGACRAVDDVKPLLPLPLSFPDEQETSKLCILRQYHGKNRNLILFTSKYDEVE